MDLETLRKEPEKWEFRTKPAWQRLLVMAGGILNNFLFAILAYICIVAIWGTSYISNDNSCIYASDLAADMGFRTGDRILMMDDYRPENFGIGPVSVKSSTRPGCSTWPCRSSSTPWHHIQ